MTSELEAERLELIDSIDGITVQLKDANRIDVETGERLNGHDYFDWKTKAESARRHKQTRLREINAILKSEREEEQTRFEEKLDRIIKQNEEIIELLTEEEDE